MNIVLFQNVNQLRKCGGYPHARLVFRADDALIEHFFNDNGKVFLFLLVFRLVEIHKDGDKRRLPVGREKRHNLILYGLHAALNFFAHTLFNKIIQLLRSRFNAEFLHFIRQLTADFLTGNLHKRR